MKTQFEQEVLSLRVDKDSFLKNDIDSPIPPDERPNFKGLNYFPPNSDYRVTSKLERFDTSEHIMMATSTGTRQALYARSLFIPFSDQTSGRETYAAGRYLDLEEQGGDDYELDFNMAYNPYCAYSEEYTCSIPPAENKLPFKILAGEKNYK